jgi:hypothetical protein
MLRITISSISGLLGLGSLGYGGAAIMSSGSGRTVLLAGLFLLFVVLIVQWRRMLTRTSMTVNGTGLSRPPTTPHKPACPPVQGKRMMEPIRPCSVSCLPKRKTEKWFAH